MPLVCPDIFLPILLALCFLLELTWNLCQAWTCTCPSTHCDYLLSVSFFHGYRKLLASYPGSSSDKRGESLEDLIMCTLMYYHIVPGKCPWALAAQAPNLRVVSYMEEVLEWFDYPCANTHPGCKVSCQGVPNWPAIAALLHRLCFIEASPAEPCSLIGKLPKNTVNKVTDGCVQNFDAGCCSAWSISKQSQLCT